MQTSNVNIRHQTYYICGSKYSENQYIYEYTVVYTCMDIIPSLLDHCLYPHYSYNPISNSIKSNRDQKKILLTRDLYLFINTYTNKIHLLICFKSIYTLISCYLSIHFQKKVLLLHQHWYCTKTVQLWNMTN